MILNIIYLIFAYLMGNIMGGKILQFIYGVDISKRGSGNVGARNAGKLLGEKAFALVAAIDVFKGFLVVIFLKFAEVSNWVIGLAILLVIVGHIRPIFFEGGKGVATFIGALIALSPNVFFLFLLGLLLIAFVTRSLTIGFYSTLPVLIVVYYLDFKDILGTLFFALTVGLIIFVALNSIKKSFDRFFLVKKRVVRKPMPERIRKEK
ncbi:MAG: glycerol-3-phosphate acyltransferase [Gemella sp.]|nr:glycerol-3-phosphate acyltransferase [Gemella sp.]